MYFSKIEMKHFSELLTHFLQTLISSRFTRSVAIVVLTIFCLQNNAHAGLGTCPVPPFTQGERSPAVMILFDTSGSMKNTDGDDVTRFDEAKQALLDFLAANKNMRFGLARMDGSHWTSGARSGGLEAKHNAIKGGRILVPVGHTGGFATSADYIIDYIHTRFAGTIDDWRNSGGVKHWTNLAETLVSIGRYFATMEDTKGIRVGMGPVGFGYYREGIEYDYKYNGNWYSAATHDDHGNPIDTTSPLQYSCEQAFVIMFTDGLPSADNDWDLVTSPMLIGDYDKDGESLDCPRADPEDIRKGISNPNDSKYGIPDNPGALYPCDTDPANKEDEEPGFARYVDDVAKFLYDHDLRSDIPGTQNIITYTIGFYVDDQLLKDTADNGSGRYFSANSALSLSTALQSALEDIKLKVSSGTAVATIASSSQTDDYMIRARFLPGSSWNGYLERFTLPYHDTDTADWEAGQLLRNRVISSGYADRKIYAYMSSQTPKKQLFTASGTIKNALKGLWGVSAGEAGKIINFIRGDDAYEGTIYKDRAGWVLGDMVYSTPVTVGAPQGWYFDNPYKSGEPAEYGSYQAFKGANSSRKTMVYVGANDGMLHAFDAANGNEDWAYIPEDIQGKLKDLADPDCHKYYVDLTPYVTDAWDESDGGGKWKTILIGGNRFGGQEYFALDITEPAHDQFKPLWDVIPFAGKLSSTIPAVGKVYANGGAVDHWVAFITSGYHDGTDLGKIAALKISDGSKVGIWKEGASFVNELTTQAKEAHIAGSPYYTMTSPAVLDSDMDGYLDLIYVGDSEGSLWKFYYDFADEAWKKFELFNTGGQAITATPALVFDADRKLRIYFGTGKYLEESDKDNHARNAFYCLIEEKQTADDPAANKGHYTLTHSLTGQLQDLTSTVTKSDFDGLIETSRIKATGKGWYFELDDPAGNPAERALSQPLVAAGVVFFTSFVPNQDVCGYGGTARLYAIDYIYGVVDDIVLPGLNSGTRHQDEGSGIPSKPVYYFDPETKTVSLLIQKSDTSVEKAVPILKERPMLIQSWRAN